MASVCRAIEKKANTQRMLRMDAEHDRDWTSIGEQLGAVDTGICPRRCGGCAAGPEPPEAIQWSRRRSLPCTRAPTLAGTSLCDSTCNVVTDRRQRRFGSPPPPPPLRIAAVWIAAAAAVSPDRCPLRRRLSGSPPLPPLPYLRIAATATVWIAAAVTQKTVQELPPPTLKPPERRNKSAQLHMTNPQSKATEQTTAEDVPSGVHTTLSERRSLNRPNVIAHMMLQARWRGQMLPRC
ncbi:uncharacterized protein [Triticum aestivum]|uniref:uncharacterized protein n=1 Tax=Triticum aestivum TaxID=4565 RepID=UPI001D01407C|nr:uncharacterized protein LOC123076934 [Triticum aestivum]